jgi:hypothetical protein
MIRKAMEKHYREWEGLMKRHAYLRTDNASLIFFRQLIA